MAKYPVFRKKDKVQIVASTRSPDRQTREFASRLRQGIVVKRNERNRRSDKPSYTVKVRVSETDHWGCYTYQEWQHYTFNATDLRKWEDRQNALPTV